MEWKDGGGGGQRERNKCLVLQLFVHVSCFSWLWYVSLMNKLSSALSFSIMDVMF